MIRIQRVAIILRSKPWARQFFAVPDVYRSKAPFNDSQLLWRDMGKLPVYLERARVCVAKSNVEAAAFVVGHGRRLKQFVT